LTHSIEELNSMHLDVLREIGNIGAGNAATSLSIMIQKKVDMKVPEVRIMDIGDVPGILGGEENVVSGIYFGMGGAIEGNIMVLMDVQSAKILTNILMGKQPEPINEDEEVTLDDMDRSALQEIGNILSASYITSLASLTNLRIDLSPPSLCVDMAGAILSVPAIQFGEISDHVLMIENKLFDGSNEVTANFFLIPDEASFGALLEALGVS